MATIKFQIKENNTLGTHSFYTQAVTYSTLDIDDLSAEISESVGVSRHTVRMVIERYADVAIRELLRGHRVKLADFLTLYPQISVSVKDTVDENGNVTKKATADMINVQLGKSSIGATVTQAVQTEFAKSVSWKKVGDDDASAKTTTDGGDGGDNGNSSGTGTEDNGNGSGTGTESASSSGSEGGGSGTGTSSTGGGSGTSTSSTGGEIGG